MKNEKLLQYIASLSDEDKVKYRDLIEESLQRDMMLTQNFTAITTCLENFAKSFSLLLTMSLQLQERLCMLNETVMEVRDASRMIPGPYSNGPVWN